MARMEAMVDTCMGEYDLNGWTVPDIHDQFLKGTRATIDGTKQAGLRRIRRA